MTTIQQLLDINSSNNAIKFVANRIQLDEYRGIQISLHNRYTKEDVIKLLSILYDVAGFQEIQIRTTDLSRRPQQIPEEKLYGEFVKRVNLALNKGTEDSIRKNYFVDFHRMGFIERYGTKHETLNPYERKPCKYVKLSQLGVSLISAKNIFTQNVIYSQGLDNIFGNLIHDIMEIISQTNKNYLTLQEYTYFVSFLGKSMNNHVYDVDDIVALLKEFNTLSKIQQKYVDDFLKEYCVPARFHGDKTDKRDYHNWYNESQQIFMLLSQTVFFELDTKRNLLPRLGQGDNCVFDSLENFKRSALAKKQYFIEHKLDKTLGYELHHIVALNFANNKNEFVLFDNWKNLIYIDGKVHAKLSQTGNINNILKADGQNLFLSDYKGSSIYLTADKEVLYNVKLQDIMINYNEQLRQF